MKMAPAQNAFWERDGFLFLWFSLALSNPWAFPSQPCVHTVLQYLLNLWGAVPVLPSLCAAWLELAAGLCFICSPWLSVTSAGWLSAQQLQISYQYYHLLVPFITFSATSSPVPVSFRKHCSSPGCLTGVDEWGKFQHSSNTKSSTRTSSLFTASFGNRVLVEFFYPHSRQGILLQLGTVFTLGYPLSDHNSLGPMAPPLELSSLHLITAHLLSPHLVSLSVRLFWGTVPQALLKSREMSCTSLPSSTTWSLHQAKLSA